MSKNYKFREAMSTEEKTSNDCINNTEIISPGNSNDYYPQNKDKTCSSTLICQLKPVFMRNKRKSSEEIHGFSNKKEKEEKRSFEKEKKTNTLLNHSVANCGATSKWKFLDRLLQKDNDGDTVLHLSIVHNDVPKSKFLIEILSGETLNIVNKLQQTPLHLSVLTCQPMLVQFLLYHGANVNMRDRNGQTALHLASKNADIDCVKAIKDATESQKYVGQKLDLNLKNFEGQAAFHLAILYGSQEIARTLLDMKANIDIQDGKCGRTALHLAVESHNINIINFLLENGTDVNATTFSGNSALHIASGLGMDQIVQLLIRNGANINIQNNEGDPPLYNIKIQRNVKWKPQHGQHARHAPQTTKTLCSLTRSSNISLKISKVTELENQIRKRKQYH